MLSGTALLLFLAAISDLAWSNELGQAELTAYFEKHIRPLLVERCLECHSKTSDDVGGNLYLDSRAGWQRGGDLGPAVIPGKPAESLLIQAIQHTHPELEMPPDGRLAKRDVSRLVEWVRQGAPDPREEIPLAESNGDAAESGRAHWSFQSPYDSAPKVPDVLDSTWPTNELDYFVLAAMERRNLKPVPPADRRTLIRRVTLDLTGLPPTPEQIEAFVRDDSPNAYSELVERLLASPRYGERWGRFWLDVARYADSNGLDENIAHGNAWRFRDYVIDSFNRDQLYDQFVKEQLAGDLLPESADADLQRRRTIATGFLSLGPKVLAEVDETKMEMDIIDEQVETVGRAFMGLTLGCARCHEHKFDPISTEDYYALAGIFKSTKTMEHFTKIARWNEVDISTDAERAQQQRHAALVKAKEAEIGELKAEIEACLEAARSRALQTKLESLQGDLKNLQAAAPLGSYAMAVADYDQATDLRVHIRGSFLSLGELVPRRFPEVFGTDDDDRPEFPSSQSGRLELANWLVSGRHPLVSRVIVNRVWRWHFGRGLVQSTDNFGRLGDRPSNQPLLDWLAIRFVEEGWSVKNLHRRIMLSSTYRLSGQHDEGNEATDPENRYYWRANMRRLEAEAIRDSILFVSGTLDETMGGSLLHVKNREFLFDHTSMDKTKYDSVRRSIYLPVIRNHLYDAFHLFDFSDASVMNSDRTTTTVAPQALFLMNSDMVTEAAASFASRICEDCSGDEGRIGYAYRLALGRPPSEEQRRRAVKFLEKLRRSENHEHEGSETTEGLEEMNIWATFCQTLLMANEFVYIP